MMLRSFPEHSGTHPPKPHPQSVWIDLEAPSADDVRLVEQMTGLTIPTRTDLDEIERSSRLYKEDGALYLSMPVVRRGENDGAPEVTPLGFVLTPERLITIRFVALPSFDSFAAELAKPGAVCTSGAYVLQGLLANIVDRVADILEQVSGELDGISHFIFHSGDALGARPKRMNEQLRAVLRRIGAVGDLTAKLRDSMLGVGRIVQYVTASVPDQVGADLSAQFTTVHEDVHSLTEYEQHLASKVDFLLNATLGFINIEQNNIIKVLTVVSVVGVPPTLVASIYGMNFEHMPELHWAYGYEYGLALVFGSALVSLLWFRIRGWL
jgi:magnesium transporter